jgi:Rrf2 family transcriptional regulator, iron-sulfur cluster assembly transcription factor
MVNQTSEHAIRALMVLAQQPPGERISADRIASLLGAPANYMAKTLNALARRGVLSSSRGPAGGFSLRVPADAISLAEVVDAFGAARPGSVCLMGTRPCDGTMPCAAHIRWTRLREAMSQPLRETSIADLLGSADREHDGGEAPGRDVRDATAA